MVTDTTFLRTLCLESGPNLTFLVFFSDMRLFFCIDCDVKDAL